VLVNVEEDVPGGLGGAVGLRDYEDRRLQHLALKLMQLPKCVLWLLQRLDGGGIAGHYTQERQLTQ